MKTKEHVYYVPEKVASEWMEFLASDLKWPNGVVRPELWWPRSVSALMDKKMERSLYQDCPKLENIRLTPFCDENKRLGFTVDYKVPDDAKPNR